MRRGGGINSDVVIFVAGLIILALLNWKKECVSSTISFGTDPGPNVQQVPIGAVQG